MLLKYFEGKKEKFKIKKQFKIGLFEKKEK